MINTQQVKQYQSELDLLETVTKAYGDLASMRMRRTRGSILSTREFLGELQNIFDEVRYSYAKKMREVTRRFRSKKTGQITLLAHNGKSVALFLSANSGLYGDIIKRTFDLFCEEVDSTNSEVTIVGKQGLALFTAKYPNRPYTYFSLPDLDYDQTQLTSVLRHIVQYDEIHIYFGKFENVASQTPSMLPISSQIKVEEGLSAKVYKDYIFEPSLEDVLAFFESEIFASVFEQAIRESQLAKLSSRILATTASHERIINEREKLKRLKFSLNHQNQDRKQRNIMPLLLSMV